MTHNRFFDEHQRETVAVGHGRDAPDRRHAGRTGGGDRMGKGLQVTDRTMRPLLVV